MRRWHQHRRTAVVVDIAAAQRVNVGGNQRAVSDSGGAGIAVIAALNVSSPVPVFTSEPLPERLFPARPRRPEARRCGSSAPVPSESAWSAVACVGNRARCAATVAVIAITSSSPVPVFTSEPPLPEKCTSSRFMRPEARRCWQQPGTQADLRYLQSAMPSEIMVPPGNHVIAA